MLEWKEQFSKIILNRGETYFLQKRVKNLTEKNGSYTAYVVGERGYSVYIGIRDEKITRMSCNCPYAGGGNKCKHMAAVLFAIDDLKKEEEEKKAAEEVKKILEEQRVSRPERYQYFDLSAISEDMQLDALSIKEGLHLIEKKKIEFSMVTTGYLDNYEEDFVAQIEGMGKEEHRNPFCVSLLVTRAGIQAGNCGCKKCSSSNYYWMNKSYNCPYQAALLLQFEQYLQKHTVGDATDRKSAFFLSAFVSKRAKNHVADVVGNNQVLVLQPRLVKKCRELKLSFKVGSSRMFVIKNLTEFCEHVKNGEMMTFGNNTQLSVKQENFSKNSLEYLNFIHQIVMEENELARRIESAYYTRNHEVSSSIEMYGWRLDSLFDMIPKSGIEYENRDGSKKGKRILVRGEKNPDIQLTVDKYKLDKQNEFHGITVKGKIPAVYRGVKNGYYIDNTIFNRIDETFMEQLETFLYMENGGEIQLVIGRNHLSDFYYTVLPELEKYFTVVERNKEEIEKYLPPEVLFRFFLDVEDGDITCKAFACYGEKEYSVLDLKREKYLQEFQMDDTRETGREAETAFIMEQWFQQVDLERDCYFCNRDEDNIYRILSEGVEALLELGEVSSTDRFRRMNIIQKPRVNVGVSLSNGLLNLEIITDDIPQAELLDLLKSYKTKKKFYRLKNGDFVSLDDESVLALVEMMESLHLTPKEFVKGKMQIPAYRTLYLEKMLEEHETLLASRDSRFRSLVKEFKTVSEADFEEPKSLSRVLRNYQKEGYRWLRVLEENCFGGILADDMGLGKTLQVITMLLAAKEEKKKGVSMIVCPASLVFNWGEEFAQFAPKLKVVLISGNQENRNRLISEAEKYDVLVTSYDLLKRDISNYEGIKFQYEVIDEAQYIKNHTTEAAKAVKIIAAKHKYALTGTPIENRLSELWSIFDYLMPGFLYSYDTFKREFETPIVKNDDEEAMNRLQKMVHPFILRRLKENVLKDLPDKLEEVQYAKFEKEQWKLYDAQIVHMQQVLAEQDESDFQKNKLKILAEITKLRQICCDPALCFENYKGTSAKMEACMELVNRAIEGGHKILLFSQFTSMLDLIEKEFQKQKISYYVITGATLKEKRLEMVKKFNADDTNVFLISLKAGGTGLNLTGADVVIHYDPWWNLAVQNQATDRAHRIGQKKKVTVYKLLAKNTIEEKIQKVQENKKNLAEQILSGEMGQIGKLTRDELMDLLS